MMKEQYYENYLSITNSFTDYNGKKILTTLKSRLKYFNYHRNNILIKSA